MPAQPITENTSVGLYIEYPRIQILTVADLLHGAEIKMPPAHGTFKQAQREKVQGQQLGFDELDD